MTAPQLHPWLGTPEALAAAHKAVQIPAAMMGGRAVLVGVDELLSEALTILTECALPPREAMATLCARCLAPLGDVRAGAKFCSPKCRMSHAKSVQRGKAETLPARTGAHIGAMWTWPEEDRTKYAIREVGYCLNNYLRTRTHGVETPASEAMANMNIPAEDDEETPAEIMADYLSEYRGVRLDGTETFEELYEAAVNLGLVEAPREPLDLAA